MRGADFSQFLPSTYSKCGVVVVVEGGAAVLGDKYSAVEYCTAPQ